MAIDAPPSGTTVLPAPIGKGARRDQHWRLRGTIAALAAFLALTAIQGAIFVVPAMPQSVLHQGILALFSDFTIPALALGVLCGGAALVTFVMVFAVSYTHLTL